MNIYKPDATENGHCMYCNQLLRRDSGSSLRSCLFCESEKETTSICPTGHFICTDCYSLSACDAIEQHCTATRERDPARIADMLLRHPSIRMHGNEYHYLVPAALLASYFNSSDTAEEKLQHLLDTRIMAENHTEGLCCSDGDCGAAVGAGIFFTVLVKGTMFDEYHRQWSSRASERSLQRIDSYGVSRCCKRDTFLAIEEAVRFLRETQAVRLVASERQQCGFSGLHQECLSSACPFYNSSGVTV